MGNAPRTAPTAFARALSNLPKETVLHCWAPLQAAFNDMNALHAKAMDQLERLFPNKATHVPDDNEPELFQMQMMTMRSQRRHGQARSASAQRRRARSMPALPMRLSPTAPPRADHPALLPPPRMRQWTRWSSVASWPKS